MAEKEFSPPHLETQKPKAGILPEKYPDLHTSKEVSFVVYLAKRRRERVPNDPKEKVSRYLGSLLNRHGLLGGGGERQRRQIGRRVIKPAEIPEAYFENQRRIAREQGHGDIEITPKMRQQLTEVVIADQTKGLENWVGYINHPDANYPAWFRYYTIRVVLTLGPYNKEKHEFPKRSRGTTAPYVDLNREALAYVYDKLNQNLEGKPIEEQADEKLASLLKSKNFGRLYAHAIEKAAPASLELRRQVNGEWVKYDQIQDTEEGRKRARALSDSLQGHGTGWCTAGKSTAEMKLKRGDFYVYYSFDQDNKPTIPRVAIRMENGQVVEVRGINEQQNLEPEFIEKAEEKLATLPGGQEYKQKASDMKRLTDIEKKHKAKEMLNPEEVLFLYEIDREIQGFGYRKDPRIQEIRRQRNMRQDFAIIFDCKPEEIALKQKELTDNTVALFDNFRAYKLKVKYNKWFGWLVRNGARFPAHLRYIKGGADFRYSQVTNLGELRSIGGDTWFKKSQLTTLGKLERIGGDAIIDPHTAIDKNQLAAITKGKICF